MISKKIKAYFNLVNYCANVLKGYVFNRSKYQIKRGYIHRNEVQFFDDTNLKDEWQNEVYVYAKQYCNTFKLNNVLDFGCGSGFKLMKYFHDVETIGVDLSPTVLYLQKKYPKKKWHSTDTISISKIESELIICSDVIEHVANPQNLIEAFLQVPNLKFLVISTPDRNLVPGKKFGPPQNPCHYREWSFEEFEKFIAEKFDVIEHVHSNFSQWTQMIVAKPKTQ